MCVSCPLEGQDTVTNPHLCDHMENLWSGAQLCMAHLSVSGYYIPLGRRPISSECASTKERCTRCVQCEKGSQTHNSMAFSVHEAKKLKGR